MQHTVVIPFQCFGTNCWSHFQGSRSPRRTSGTLGTQLHREWRERYLVHGVMPAIRVDTALEWQEGGSLSSSMLPRGKCPWKVKPLPSAAGGD